MCSPNPDDSRTAARRVHRPLHPQGGGPRPARPREDAQAHAGLELVYDNYNTLAIGFSPTERAGDGILSIALFPSHASLFFLQGARLRDPTNRPMEILAGEGRGCGQ